MDGGLIWYKEPVWSCHVATLLKDQSLDCRNVTCYTVFPKALFCMITWGFDLKQCRMLSFSAFFTNFFPVFVQKYYRFFLFCASVSLAQYHLLGFHSIHMTSTSVQCLCVSVFQQDKGTSAGQTVFPKQPDSKNFSFHVDSAERNQVCFYTWFYQCFRGRGT